MWFPRKEALKIAIDDGPETIKEGRWLSAERIRAVRGGVFTANACFLGGGDETLSPGGGEIESGTGIAYIEEELGHACSTT